MPLRKCCCLAIVTTLVTIVACRTIPIEDREPLRQKINDRASETIETIVEKKPEVREKIDDSAGYFFGRVSGVKAPVIGFGTGLGVLVDKEQSTRTYLNINRFDLGMGLGSGTVRVLALFQDRKALEKFSGGKWTGGLGLESGAGEKATVTAAQVDEGLKVLLVPETGAAFLATARLVKVSVNEDLTDTGVSEVGIPNRGFDRRERQGNDAPRKWEHRLPFFAQKVIDKGFDLPLPYGIGLTFAHVDQENLIDGLEVGINGREKAPFQFVSFENVISESNSLQLKLDTWLFPFMNVFALLGKVEGDAPVDVILDGNDTLDYLEIDCSGPLPNPLCNLLQDQTIKLPTIPADFSGWTYGVGTVLAGGWNNWFVAVPISFTYADMEGTDSEGIAVTVTPRLGRTFNLNKWGNLSLYGGGNYLDVELTVTGQVSTPDGLLVIDYTVDQENKDNWNLVTGVNWDINKRWSLAAEYNGFIGSREAVIISLGTRF
jgi:hypothetical protein